MSLVPPLILPQKRIKYENTCELIYKNFQLIIIFMKKVISNLLEKMRF